MTNDNLKNQKPIKLPPQKSVIILKLLILIVILLISLVFMIVYISKTFFSLNRFNILQPINQNLNQTAKPIDEFNFEAPLPTNQMGNISKVPKEKIETLFENLKK